MHITLDQRPSRVHDGNQGSRETHKSRNLAYPGRATDVAWRYTVTLRILEMIHEALVKDSAITKRDIFYRDPNLFTKQEIVDRYVDDVAFALGVPRCSLNVTSTAKGLITGAIAFHKDDGTVVDARSEPEGVLISSITKNDRTDVSDVKWILIVEKEATFRSLVESSFNADLKRHGILVTAKGYPDVATRALLNALSGRKPHSCTMYALVDFDPDGLEILSTYKHGSAALNHENSDLAVRDLNWLGVDSGHFLACDTVHVDQNLLRLSLRDRSKAVQMLGRGPFGPNGVEPKWRVALFTMLMLNTKAEIQLLEGHDGGLSTWVSRELNR